MLLSGNVVDTSYRLRTGPAKLDALATLVQTFVVYMAGVLGTQQAEQAAALGDGIEEMLRQAPLNHLQGFVTLANAVRPPPIRTVPPFPFFPLHPPVSTDPGLSLI